MAVTITDRRTIYDQADATTGWTGGGFGVTTTDVAEASGAVADSLAIATGQTYFTGGSIDLSATLVYVWLFNNALQGSWTTGATALVLGDGTDLIAFHLAGGDRKVFTHLDGPVSWQCAVLDGGEAATKNTAGETTVVSGSFAALSLAAITDVGGHFITGSKALGGGYNVAVDILRYGNDGIRITAGGVGTEGNFLEIALADRSTANLAAHGCVRELAPIAFGVQAPLTFGESGAATNSYFEESGVSIIYEAWDIGDDKYYFNVEGNAGSTNSFVLTNSTIATGGPLVSITCNSGNIDTLTFDGVAFSQLGNGILFSNSGDATGHSVVNCGFDGCGQIDPGDVTFESNTIQNSTALLTGAVLLDADGTANWLDLNFIGGSGLGHGIYATAAGTYSFNGHKFTGFGITTSTDAAVYNNSGGLVTINVSGGGDSPTYRNGAGASTVINNNINITITIADQLGVAIPGAQVSMFQSDGTIVFSSTSTDELGQVASSAAASLGAVIIRVRQNTNAATFATTTGVNGGTEVITTDANHHFQNGDGFTYDKDGGSAVIGLTDGTVYYAGNVTANTLEIFDTAVNAIAGGATGLQNLTANLTEVHLLDPIRYNSASASGTIASGDFATSITMITDNIATG